MAQAVPNIPSEEDEICLHAAITQADPIVSIDRFSSFTRLRRVTAWLIRFARNCQGHKKGLTCTWSFLAVAEFLFGREIGSLKIRLESHDQIL